MGPFQGSRLEECPVHSEPEMVMLACPQALTYGEVFRITQGLAASEKTWSHSHSCSAGLLPAVICQSPGVHF
jgi:hypothetical protein